MNLISVLWPMIAAACLTLAVIHFFAWLQQRAMRANLLFCVFAVSTAILAGLELLMMHAQSPEEYGVLVRWYHIPAAALILSMMGFVGLYLRSGRPWLAWTVVATRILAVGLNFILTPNLNFREITALRQIQFLGESVSVPVGTPNPWMFVGNFSLLLTIIFIADATITAWRRGDRRRALLVGGSILFFATAGALQIVLAMWQVMPSPLILSHYYLIVVIAMGFQLSQDILHAARLARDLQSREAALRESEYHMGVASEMGSLGIWIRDFGRDEIWASDRWRALYGFTKTDRLSLEVILLRLHSEDREVLIRTLQKVAEEKGEYEADFRIVLPDGKIRWISSHGRVEIDASGKPIRMRGVSLDITVRKQAEERLRLVVEAAPSAIIMVSPEGIMTLVNAQVEAVFGYGRQELIGHPIEMLVPEQFRTTHPDYHDGYRADLKARAMGTGRELFGRRKDGSHVPLEIGLSPVQTSDGLFVLASIIDVTQRRAAEHEAQKQRNELAHLSRVMVLGELSSSLAHELNQPLGAILRNAEAAEMILAAPAPDLDELRAIIADIHADDRRAGDVIGRLRSLLKNRQLESLTISLATLVDEVISFVRGDALTRGVHLQIDMPRNLPPVRGDRVHLQQVLLNLIINGMDAVHDRPHRERRVIIRAMVNADKMVEVAVSDTGGGIPAESLVRVFEPFFTSKPNGMGIGLAVSRTIIEAHQGKIWAENNADRGAAVRFTVPAAVEGGLS